MADCPGSSSRQDPRPSSGNGGTIWAIPFDVHTPPFKTDEQPVINLCKTSKPPVQQTVVVFDARTIQYKNVLQSMTV